MDTVHRICLYCADKFGWETTPFITAYQKVLAADFIYSKETKKKTSKDKKYKAAIGLEKLDEYALITARFYDKKDNFLKQVELLKTFDHEMFYGRIINNFKWFSNEEFGVANVTDEIIIKASVNNLEADISIKPVHTNIEELEGALRRITYREFKNEQERIEWMNK